MLVLTMRMIKLFIVSLVTAVMIIITIAEGSPKQKMNVST
jgi:hypothetical protein